LYHMVTGRPPFVADGAGEIIALQMFGDVVPPSRLAPVSAELDRLVLRLLEKDPAQRFASAGDVVTALTRLDQPPTNRTTQPEAAARDLSPLRDSPAMSAGNGAAAPIPRRSLLLRVAGAIVLLASAGAAAMYATREASRSDEPPSAPIAPV